MAHAVVLHLAGVAHRVEVAAVGEPLGRSDEQARQDGDVHAGVVGDLDEVSAVAVDLVFQAGHGGVLEDAGVVEVDSLGAPGGAAGVNDAEVVVGTHFMQGVGGCGRGGLGQGVEVAVDVDDGQVELVELIAVLGVGDGECGVGVVEHLLQLHGTEPEIEPHIAAAGLGDAAHHLHHLGAVGHQQGHPVAFGQAVGAQQGVGDAVGALVELAVVQLALAENGGVAGVAGPVAGEGQTDVHWAASSGAKAGSQWPSGPVTNRTVTGMSMATCSGSQPTIQESRCQPSSTSTSAST